MLCASEKVNYVGSYTNSPEFSKYKFINLMLKSLKYKSGIESHKLYQQIFFINFINVFYKLT